MCLALPARIVEMPAPEVAVVDMGGARKRISIALVPEAKLGDFVIVHVGHAIGMLDEEEALASLRAAEEARSADAARRLAERVDSHARSVGEILAGHLRARGRRGLRASASWALPINEKYW